jgi:outer membrane PBP1 activator LpoA protein
VGPLLRDDLKTLAISDADIPWTVALNQLDDRSPLPPAVYSFALAVEADARAIARRALLDGVRAVAVITGDPPLMQRLAGTFTAAWIAGGGAPPLAFRFDPAPEALALLRRNLARATPDAVVLAVDGGEAALVKSFVGSVPAYASGLVFERPELAVVRDLNDVRTVEVPWLVTPDAPEIANFPRRDFGSAALERLYALGVDAFRVSESFGDEPPERFLLDGATGRITLNEGRQFAREGRFAVYRDGQLVPLDAAR